MNKAAIGHTHGQLGAAPEEKDIGDVGYGEEKIEYDENKPAAEDCTLCRHNFRKSAGHAPSLPPPF